MVDRLEKPFIALFAGPRGRGKTYMMRETIKRKFNDFDVIAICSPSVHLNHDYDPFYVHPDLPSYELTPFEKECRKKIRFFDTNAHSVIDDIFDQCVEAKAEAVASIRNYNAILKRKLCFNEDTVRLAEDSILEAPHVLIVLDDPIDSGVVTYRNITDKVGERGRHCNLSLMVGVQVLRLLSTSLRQNFTHFVFFSPANILEFEKYIEEFVPKAERKEYAEKFLVLFETKFQFILIDNTEIDQRKKLKTGNTGSYLANKIQFIMPSKPRDPVSKKRKGRCIEDVDKRRKKK